MCFFSLFLSLSVVLMWRMACQWVAVHWTLRLARVLVWYFRPTSPTVSAASHSSTALTQTLTFRPKPCPATHPLPATCEYFKDAIFNILLPLNQPGFNLYFMLHFTLLSWFWKRSQLVCSSALEVCSYCCDNSRWWKVFVTLMFRCESYLTG